MAVLVTIKGPDPGKQFTLHPYATSMGRQVESAVHLESQAVSRQHARIICEDGNYFIEDLQSSNGTYLNGKLIKQRMPVTEQDTIQIGPYYLGLRESVEPKPLEESFIIREKVSANASSVDLLSQDPAYQLQVVLEISQHLARTLDPVALFGKLVDHLMRLFPQADRGMVLLGEEDRLTVKGMRCRNDDETSSGCPYSRTIVRTALDEGIGILSEDVGADQRFVASSTLTSLNLRSLLCVPMIAPEGKRLGVLQLDRFQPGGSFTMADLKVLTAIGLQVAVVLENAALHVEVLREERLRQEVGLAREIQEGFLPSIFPNPDDAGFELFARVLPAREVSGDFYDFFHLEDGRLAFFVGDVSGKGMPAALFMIAVRTLGRHLGVASSSPAETLARLNSALAVDNPSGMFVTLLHGLYEPKTGDMTLTSCGHPLPLLRKPDGRVEGVKMDSGRILGYEEGDLNVKDFHFVLKPGETMIMYTDGCTEAHAPGAQALFGLRNLQEVVGGSRTKLTLQSCADQVKAAVERFTGTTDLQDDLTLMFLRRTPVP